MNSHEKKWNHHRLISFPLSSVVPKKMLIMQNVSKHFLSNKHELHIYTIQRTCRIKLFLSSSMTFYHFALNLSLLSAKYLTCQKVFVFLQKRIKSVCFWIHDEYIANDILWIPLSYHLFVLSSWVHVWTFSLRGMWVHASMTLEVCTF